MTEWEFISEIANRADCFILFDVNNIYVSSVNHGFDPLDYLNGVPGDRIHPNSSCGSFPIRVTTLSILMMRACYSASVGLIIEATLQYLGTYFQR